MDRKIMERFEKVIVKPGEVARIWNSSHMKEDLITVFQEYFKPKSSIEQEKVEYNEINIFAEFQLYNLIFAKNELLYNDHKCAVLLDLFWKLLEINPEGPTESDTTEDPNEDPFHTLLSRKFTLFRGLLLSAISDPLPSLQFTAEEAKRIAAYVHESYFKHLRLYDYVLNNKQLCEVKRIQVHVNEPIIATALTDALLLGQEETLPYEDEDGELRLEIQR